MKKLRSTRNVFFSPPWRSVVVWSLMAMGIVTVPSSFSFADEASGRLTENVIVVTFDGLRCQELFGGADSRLLNRNYGEIKKENLAEVKTHYWDDDTEKRREKLLPFIWGTVAKQGQIFGDASQGCEVTVANQYRFSSPGYSEIFSGFPDNQIDSNDKIPNPNPTVLGWLNARPGFEGRVAAFTSWDVFPFILNAQRDHLTVNAGWTGSLGPAGSKQTEFITDIARGTPHYFPEVRFDVFTQHVAIEYLQAEKPRVLYAAFGETDDWGHVGRYDLVLDSARSCDRFVRNLWETAQSIPQYAGKTSLVITTDHGRGETPSDWKSHKDEIPGSEKVWIAVMGPDTPATGIRSDQKVTFGQVAATIADLLGEDYGEAVPRATPPLPGVH